MTIQRTFFNWSTSGLPYSEPPFEDCSPNLVQLRKYLRERWGGYSLGCEGDRPIREGTVISSHAFGAAEDWRYTPVTAGNRDVPRHVAIGEVLPFIINNSAELHIQAIHDYFGDRIWRAGRTANVDSAHTTWWKIQNGAGSGMGETWATYFHFETTFDGWADATAVVDRLHGTTPPPVPPAQPDSTEDLMLAAIAKTVDGADLAQFSFRGQVFTVGSSAAHDVTHAEVFGRGGGKAFDIVGGNVVSWTPDNPGSWGAVKASKTKAQVLALMAGTA